MNIKHLFIGAFALVLMASCAGNKVKTNPTETLTIKIKTTGGKNGTAVAYDPQKKLYYTAIAGNSTFPFEVFNENGVLQSSGKTGVDVRGLWWNSAKNVLQCNAYSDIGLFNYELKNDGLPTGELETLTKNTGQPTVNSVGAYNPIQNQILYYYNGLLYKVDADNYSPQGSIALKLPVDKELINQTTVIYTGIKKKEVGLLNHNDKKLYLFNIASGKLTATIQLPKSAPTYEFFRFSFANGYVWLYDAEERLWTGYKIVK